MMVPQNVKNNTDIPIVFGVSDFVAVFNQTLEYAYPSVSIVGELSDFRISKNKWLYFDLKDDTAKAKFFGTVYNLPGPLEDGLILEVRGQPRLHPLYGFSISVQSIQPVGEGSIRKAASLLEAKLAKEGLFDVGRKRPLPYPPKKIGLITAKDSSAYHDFIKILNERWGGVKILHVDTQVQGEAAIAQIVEAMDYFNTNETLDAVVVTRGGGSQDDLAVFNAEQVVRAIASSSTSTLVAIGHEVDISLAELAADQRASTPTNAAQLLVPDKKAELINLHKFKKTLRDTLKNLITTQKSYLQGATLQLNRTIDLVLVDAQRKLTLKSEILSALSPQAALKRGYAVLKSGGTYIKSVKQLRTGNKVTVSLSDGSAKLVVDRIE